MTLELNPDWLNPRYGSEIVMHQKRIRAFPDGRIQRLPDDAICEECGVDHRSDVPS